MSARPDLDRLAALAAAATPGPWEYSDMGPSVFTTSEESFGGGICVAEDAYPRGENHPNENMRMIAACDPATLTWLVERVRECEQVAMDIVVWHDLCVPPNFCPVCARARAALDALLVTQEPPAPPAPGAPG